ncbi:DegT/DnrJ/EryC1/StrS family aminotransferase [Candidatus Soleaferrea massiliensis]|uniref:DegT/DnrJ/EryC1/StrS family aminotransferase n=1 Tax=Candidatus Soleaferrea massiliensis TaxID=1470354 RepID=UPI0005916568|nr:DegT/DnrJ/EryC1/StrS family aminotransferase [Candidatus Soleaferrea massiliensis]
MDRNIPFSPPDITQLEIDEVVDTLKSGWITTGPKTKQFEREIADFCDCERAACLNSATAALELALRVLGIGKGDEVITSAYTYTASASVILHVGATPVLVDTAPGSYQMDYERLEAAITPLTKAVIPVDIAGVMCDYDRIFDIVERKKALFNPENDLQKAMGRAAVVADGAHSFGAQYHGRKSGSVADFTSFSFHAVKNLTTAEGGAIVWNSIEGIESDDLYREFMLLSLHGQSKDALAKTKVGAWEYDVVYPAYKCNMTDIMAALGLAQLKRYPALLQRRKELVGIYDRILKDAPVEVLPHYLEDDLSSGHLYLVRIEGVDAGGRNRVIERMAQRGICTNVHYKPLPMMTAYQNLGFDIADYPNAYRQFQNEITLPLHTLLSDEDARYVAETLRDILNGR